MRWNDLKMIKIELSKTIKLTVPRFHLFSSSDIEFQLSKNDISDSDFSVFCSSMAYFFEFSRSLGSSASNAVSWIGSTSKFEHALVLFHPILECSNLSQKCWPPTEQSVQPWFKQSFAYTVVFIRFRFLRFNFDFLHFSAKMTIFFKTGQIKELTASSFFVSNKKFTFSIVLIVNHGWKFLNLIKDSKPQITIKEAIRAWP